MTDLLPPVMGHITINQAGVIFSGSTDGWLRKWESPYPGRSYLCVMTGKSVAVWRQACDYNGSPRVAAMVAACVTGKDHHITILTEWAYEAHRYFGDCLVMVDAKSCPTAIPDLRDRGAMMWTRQQRDEKRPLGQMRPVRHIGWDMTDLNRAEGLVAFQRLFTDSAISIPCAQTLLELEGMYHASGQLTAVAEEQDWLNNAAMAAMGLPSATPFTPQVFGGSVLTDYGPLQRSLDMVPDHHSQRPEVL
jgi:hypothetical protein